MTTVAGRCHAIEAFPVGVEGVPQVALLGGGAPHGGQLAGTGGWVE